MEKKQWSDKLRKVLNDANMTDNEVSKMNAEIAQLKMEVKKLQSKRDQTVGKVDDKLAFYRQQYNAVQRKKGEKETSLKDLLDEKRELNKEHEGKEAQLAEMLPERMLRGEALDKYVHELRRKTLLFKKYKAEQNTILTEFGVLQRTQSILESRENDLRQNLRKKEAERGITGYEETQSKLEQVSAMKSDFDEVKGKTLDEISRVVTEINKLIKVSIFGIYFW